MTLQIDTKFKKNLTIGFKRNRNIGEFSEASHKINLIVPAEDILFNKNK